MKKKTKIVAEAFDLWIRMEYTFKENVKHKQVEAVQTTRCALDYIVDCIGRQLRGNEALQIFDKCRRTQDAGQHRRPLFHTAQVIVCLYCVTLGLNPYPVAPQETEDGNHPNVAEPVQSARKHVRTGHFTPIP